MKLIYCKICRDLVPLRMVVRSCECQNVLGRFLDDNFSIELDVCKGNWNTVRVVGIDNRLLLTDVLPKYTKTPDSPLLFDHWGSAVFIVPPWMLSEAHKMNPDRYPEVEFVGDR